MGILHQRCVYIDLDFPGIIWTLVTTFSYIPFQTLGANLVWRSASEGITVSVDMTVTLFNKEQFAENR